MINSVFQISSEIYSSNFGIETTRIFGILENELKKTRMSIISLSERKIVSPFSARSRFNENAHRLVANIFQGIFRIIFNRRRNLFECIQKAVEYFEEGISFMWKFFFVESLDFPFEEKF